MFSDSHTAQEFELGADKLKYITNWGIDLSKIIQVSMDGPSVNWKFYDELVKQRQEMELHQLINIGSCGLHIIHSAFKTGVEKTDWCIKNTLKGSFQIMHDTPARRSDYPSITGSDIFLRHQIS